MGRSPYDANTSTGNLHLQTEGRSRSPSPRPDSRAASPNVSRNFFEQNPSVYSLPYTAEPISECASPTTPAVVIPIPDSEPSLPPGVQISATSPHDVMNRKYERNVIIPDDFERDEVIKEIDALKLIYNPKQPPTGWRPEACPEGKLYFRHEANRVLTHNDLYDAQRAADIQRLMEAILHKLGPLRSSLPEDTEIVLDIFCDEDQEPVYGYYLISWTNQVVFWLEKQKVGFLTIEERPALSDTHLRHAMLHQFWTHVEMFPNHYAPTEELLRWFRGWLTYALSDSISSDTSTIPFNHNRLTDLSKLVSSIKVGGRDRFGICALAKPLKEIHRDHFLNFHGQPGARLNRDESVYKASLRRPRTVLFRMISLFLFHTPYVYMRHLEEVWVDNTVNYRPWQAFVTEMRRDWKASITPATVLLSANVGFLAIQSIDTDRPDRSLAQIMSYISTLLCLCNYIVCQVLMRQHRHGHRELVSEAVEYLYRRDNSTGGLESVAVTFSLPSALFMWSMLTFLVAMSYVCFFQTTYPTQVAVGTLLGFLGVIVCLVLYMDWGGVARSLDFSIGLVVESFANTFKSRKRSEVSEPQEEEQPAPSNPEPTQEKRQWSMYSVGSEASTATAVDTQDRSFARRIIRAWRWFGRMGKKEDEKNGLPK